MSDFISKNKVHILGIVCLLFFLLLILLYFSSNKIVIVSTNGVLVHKFGSWKYDSDVSKYSGKRYYVFADGVNVGMRTVNYDNGLSILNSTGKSVDYSYDIFASSSRNINVIAYYMLHYDDTLDFYLSSFIDYQNLIGYGESYSASLYDYDYDGDGVLEKIISVSNYIDLSAENFYSALFIVDNDNFVEVGYNVTTDISKLEIYNLDKVVDIKRDGKIEFIVNNTYYGHPEKTTQCIYNYIGGKVKSLSKC